MFAAMPYDSTIVKQSMPNSVSRLAAPANRPVTCSPFGLAEAASRLTGGAASSAAGPASMAAPRCLQDALDEAQDEQVDGDQLAADQVDGRSRHVAGALGDELADLARARRWPRHRSAPSARSCRRCASTASRSTRSIRPPTSTRSMSAWTSTRAIRRSMSIRSSRPSMSMRRSSASTSTRSSRASTSTESTTVGTTCSTTRLNMCCGNAAPSSPRRRTGAVRDDTSADAASASPIRPSSDASPRGSGKGRRVARSRFRHPAARRWPSLG